MEIHPDEKGATCAGLLTRAAARGAPVKRMMRLKAFAYRLSKGFSSRSHRARGQHPDQTTPSLAERQGRTLQPHEAVLNKAKVSHQSRLGREVIQDRTRRGRQALKTRIGPVYARRGVSTYPSVPWRAIPRRELFKQAEGQPTPISPSGIAPECRRKSLSVEQNADNKEDAVRTYAEIVRGRAQDEHEGLRFEGQSWTWAEIIDEAATRAAFLETIEPGAGRSQVHVGVLLQNTPDFVFWLLAAALSGDVVVGINPTRRGSELIHDIAHADCDLLISEPLYLEADDCPEIPVPAERIFDVESRAYAQLLLSHTGATLPEKIPDHSSIYLLLFSSGSTGAPKAVICTQGRLGALTGSMKDRISLHRDSVNYLYLPLFHGHGIMMNLATAAQVGATIFMVRKFSASRFSRDIREHRVTFLNYVGRVLSYVLAQPEDPADLDNSLEVAFGSEASPAEVLEFQRRFACEVREGYGASEGVIRIVPVPEAPSGSLGLPVGGLTAEIRSDDGTECPRARFDEHGRLLNAEEATGEIVVVGAGSRFEGYYKNPDAMAERLRFGGEDFWTGDLAYRDEEGYFYFGGRSSDWLRVDGENFATAPLERIISHYPAASGVHAYAVPDPRTGDQVMCTIVLRPGHEFNPTEFADFLDAQPALGTKWRPTFVRIVDNAPTTANGKIDKAPLRKTAWEAENVWWAPRRTSPFLPLNEEERKSMRAEFIEAGRINSLPFASQALVVVDI